LGGGRREGEVEGPPLVEVDLLDDDCCDRVTTARLA